MEFRFLCHSNFDRLCFSNPEVLAVSRGVLGCQASSFRNYFSVDWNYTNGLTFYVNGAPIFTNVPTTGFAPALGMFFSWAARTGTNAEDARIDNLCVYANANLLPIQLLPPFMASGSTPGNAVSNAFDGNFNTQWQVASSSGWIQANSTNSSESIAAYAIVSSTNNWQQDPQSWTLQGSDDGTNWATIDAEYLEGWGNTNAYMQQVPRTLVRRVQHLSFEYFNQQRRFEHGAR